MHTRKDNVARATSGDSSVGADAGASSSTAASGTETTGAPKPKASTRILDFYVFTRNGYTRFFYYSVTIYPDLLVHSHSNHFQIGPKN